MLSLLVFFVPLKLFQTDFVINKSKSKNGGGSGGGRNSQLQSTTNKLTDSGQVYMQVCICFSIINNVAEKLGS